MIKLKTILGEGYAWEREAGKPLPTLEQTTAAYAAKMQEQSADQAISNSMNTYDSMSDWELMAAAERAGMEEEIIIGYDGYLENRNELIHMLQNDSSAMQYEQAKPDYIDADGDGNEKESMKKAFADKEDSSFSEYSIDALTDMKINLSRYDGNEDQIARINREIAKRKQNESINELSDDEIDSRWNKPQQMWQRQFNTSQMPNDTKSSNTSNSSKSTEKAPPKFYQEKLAALKAQRKQLEFDMEQEAEPEGGPVADYYGDALQNIDDQIDSIKKKMSSKNESTNEATLITKAGLQEMRELPLEDRILRNLKGNDYILRETFKK